MKMELENVGKISRADIELNGITVIAGENNTGKSTIGKMLYCVFHAFHEIGEQVREERAESVSRVLGIYYREASGGYMRGSNTMTLARQIVDEQGKFSGNMQLLAEAIEKYFSRKDQNFRLHTEQEALEKLAGRISAFLKPEDAEIQKSILKKRLEAEFGMKVSHVNSRGKAHVKVKIKDSLIDFTVTDNGDITVSDYMNLTKEIIYLDDPFILDTLGDRRWAFFADRQYGHRQDLLYKLEGGRKGAGFSVVDELIVKNKLGKVMDVMQNVCSGDIITDDTGAFAYKTDQLDAPLDMVNLSAGMKNFIILRRLLENGSIDENGIIILDEPEIHLHPEWQLKFAEIIVLLQKEFSANILLTTHSPYFLSAVEVYSGKYGTGDTCRYYLVEERDDAAAVRDVTGKTEKIYEKLARPLQELENLEYGNGMPGID